MEGKSHFRIICPIMRLKHDPRGGLEERRGGLEERRDDLNGRKVAFQNYLSDHEIETMY